MKKTKLLLIIFFMLFFSIYAQTTIYNNFGPGDSYQGGWTTISSNQWVGCQFSVGSLGYSNITVEAVLWAFSPGNLTVSIYNDDGSGLPTGAALTSAAINVTNSFAIQSVNFASLSLSPGNYHVVVSPGSVEGSWNTNDQGENGVSVSNNSGASWSYSNQAQGALRITGITPLPVELISFRGVLVDNTIQLNWETATETNNYGFQVQRKKINNKNEDVWENVGFVKGYGTTNSPKSYSFINDLTLTLNLNHIDYRLKQIDNDGTFTYSKIVTVDLSNITSIDDINYEYSLEQNYPNPFNPTTRIEYQVASIDNVKLVVYNSLGQRVATLVNEQKTPGIYYVKFDGSMLSSGVYIYCLRAGKYVETRKLILMK